MGDRNSASRLYVGGLDTRITERDLEDEFTKFGVLRSVWVARKPPGFAFVEFEDIRDAEDAMRKLDGHNGWRVEQSRKGERRPPPGGGGGGGYGDRGGGGYGGPPRGEMKCYECGELGHMARDCRAGRGGGGGGGGGGGSYRDRDDRGGRGRDDGYRAGGRDRSPPPRRRSPSYEPRDRRSPSYGKSASRSRSPRRD
ncbi:hypothetical protein WJX72_002269 [[Myrmecia] bisecta]|uniref:Uncharacterized protein n=1 Tax=[Myrmecia] bisecta TaxID=41462 RepID=A0AAW1QPK3_9CHLO